MDCYHHGAEPAHASDELWTRSSARGVSRQRRLHAALAELGPVLVLHAPDANRGSCECALNSACSRLSLVPRVGLGSDGVVEELRVLDAEGVGSLRLVRLPDSDFLAWDRATAILAAYVDLDHWHASADTVSAASEVYRSARPRPQWSAFLAEPRGQAGQRLGLACLHRCSPACLLVLDALRERETIALSL